MSRIDDVKAQLLEAYVQKDMAEEKIKALRNVLAGIQLAEQEAKDAEKQAIRDAATQKEPPNG